MLYVYAEVTKSTTVVSAREHVTTAYKLNEINKPSTLPSKTSMSATRSPFNTFASRFVHKFVFFLIFYLESHSEEGARRRRFRLSSRTSRQLLVTSAISPWRISRESEERRIYAGQSYCYSKRSTTRSWKRVLLYNVQRGCVYPST